MNADSAIPEFLMSQGLSAQSSRSWRSSVKRRNGIRLFTSEQIGSVDATHPCARQPSDAFRNPHKNPGESLTADSDLSALNTSSDDVSCVDGEQGMERPIGSVIAELLNILKGDAFVAERY